MKSAFIILFLTIINSIAVYGQYKVEAPAPKCNLPECMEEAGDTAVVPNSSRGISQPNNTTQQATIPQKVYHIESLNAIFFIPEAFVPIESAFNINGAIRHISKVQIYKLDNEELIFQTSVPENAWNGKWQGKVQYGFFKYIISIQIDKNTIEKIEGIVETKNPL